MGKINRLNIPVEDYLKSILKDSSLRDIISQHFFKGTPTFFALSYFSLYLDYFYPKGGVGILADAIEKKIKDFKGHLKPNTFIKEVHAAQKLIVDDQQEKYAYENLIWAADLKTFYNMTNTNQLKKRIQKNFAASRNKIMSGRGSESVFSLYLQVDLPLSYFKEIANGHFFYTPSKVGLNEIHRSELKSLLNDWENIEKAEVQKWFSRYLPLNTFEISIPGLKDESLVPENKSGLIVSFIVDFELFDKLKKSGWLDEVQAEIETKIVNILSDTIYPQLKSNIIKHFTFTPFKHKKQNSQHRWCYCGLDF